MFLKQKTQILIAHQKEDIDRTQKSSLVGKKSFLGFRAFRTCFWEVDHPLYDVIGVQDFEKAKIYKPTWTKIGLRPIFVLRWNYYSDIELQN